MKQDQRMETNHLLAWYAWNFRSNLSAEGEQSFRCVGWVNFNKISPTRKLYRWKIATIIPDTETLKMTGSKIATIIPDTETLKMTGSKRKNNITKGGGIAQLVSHLPLQLGIWVRFLVGGFDLGHPMHEWEEKRLSAVKSHIASVSLTDWCLMIFWLKTNKKHNKSVSNLTCFSNWSRIIGGIMEWYVNVWRCLHAKTVE